MVKVDTAAQRWYDKNKKKLGFKLRLKSWRLKTRYGITLDEYNKMLKEQNNLCLICKKEKSLHVDHCHNSGKVRGLLCYQCNNGLGCFKDNPGYVENALNYLRIG